MKTLLDHDLQLFTFLTIVFKSKFAFQRDISIMKIIAMLQCWQKMKYMQVRKLDLNMNSVVTRFSYATLGGGSQFFD